MRGCFPPAGRSRYAVSAWSRVGIACLWLTTMPVAAAGADDPTTYQPPDTVPATAPEQALFATKLARVNGHSGQWPVAVTDVIKSLDVANPYVAATLSCAGVEGKKADKVAITVRTYLVGWASPAIKEQQRSGIYTWGLPPIVGMIADGESTKTVEFRNWIALNLTPTEVDETTWAGKITDETLLYHELLHGQLHIDLMKTDAWRMKVCTCQTDASGQDANHATIPGHETSYLSAVVGAEGGAVYDRVKAKADKNGAFRIPAGPKKFPNTLNVIPGPDANVKNLRVEVDDTNSYVCGELVDPKKDGKFYARIDPPGHLTVLGLEEPVVVEAQATEPIPATSLGGTLTLAVAAGLLALYLMRRRQVASA